MGDENGKKYITWAQGLTMAIGILGLLGGLQTFVWAMHASHPHKGAVTQQQFQEHVRRLDQFIADHREFQRWIRDKLDKR